MRNFVWDENCYWWEVVTTPTAEGYYRSINADHNGDYNYYYYDSAAACWKIKKITVTWNIEGSTTNYSVGYGTKPEWLGANPTKTSTSSNYVWRWDGWTMGSDPTVLANNDLPYVTENTTFTAHFYEKYYEYNITFKNDDGSILESKNWIAGATPTYEGTPTKNPTAAETYEFNGTWTPTIAVVSGSATYVAQYDATPRAYTITFLNYDMSELGTAEVVYNGTPTNDTYLAAVAPVITDPYKPDNSAYSFEFAGWRLQGASENGFAQVKGNQTYVAQFAETTKKYRITFLDDDGETVLHWTQLEYGATPSYDGPALSEKHTAETSYLFTGWTPAEFEEVEGPQTYTANWIPIVASVAAGGETTYHTTVASAISAANGKTDAVVTMLQNASVTSEIEITAAMTIDLNDKTILSTKTNIIGVFKINASGKTVTIKDSGTTGKIAHIASGTVYLSGINLAAGSLNIESGTIYAENTNTTSASANRACGIYYKTDNNASISMSNGTIEAKRTGTFAYGLYLYYAKCGLTLTGGTVIASGSGSVRGIYTQGIAELTNVTVTATAALTGDANCYAVFSDKNGNYTINSGTYTATSTSTGTNAYAISLTKSSSATTGGSAIVKGGRFSGMSKELNISNGTITLQGGYYVHNTDLAVNCATNYHVLDLTGEDPYLYKVAEAYTITFKNGDNNTIQSGLVEEGTMPEYNGTTPTKTATEQYTYTFNGWDPAITEVTADATYTAQFSSTPRTYDVTLNTNGGTISSGNVESYTYKEGATLPTDVTREGYTFDGWYDNSGLNGDAVTTISTTATGDKKYWAKWSAIEYTITWRNWNGDPLKEPTITSTINYGNPPGYPLGGNNPAPTREASDGKTYEWDGWTTGANGAGSFYSIDNLPDATGDATYYAHFRITAIDVASTTDVSIEEDAEVTTTTVRVEGKLNVPENRTLTTDDLILEATPSSSGEITGSGTVTATHAYFDFSNGAEGFKARRWYAVAVPWQVEVTAYGSENGVYLTNDGENYTRQVLGSTFDLIYYDGERRAAEGHSDNCWKYVEDDDQEKHIMYPGRAYMIYLTSDAQTIRFERKSGTDLITNTLAVYAFTLGTGNDKDANWNGIANPATYHAYINANVKNYSSGDLNVGQVYNAETRTYSVVNMDENNLIVGQPIFVQAIETNTSVVAYAAHDDAFHAPRRAKAQGASTTRYEVMFAPNEGDVTDRIIVRLNEEKEENAYIVGQDLVKMGVSDIVPQMWVDRYDGKMCINTVAPVNNRADYPLSISVQKSGAYDLFIDDQPDDETMLYLTYDGEAIWNLSYGGYVANLEKGSNTHYGLRIVRSPKVTTGIEETTIQNGDVVRKVVIEDKVFIIRNGQVFGIDGRLAK